MREQSFVNRLGKKLFTVLLPERLRVVLYPLLRGRPPVNPFRPRTFNDLLNRNKLTERYAEVCILQDKLLAKSWVALVAPEVKVPRTLKVLNSADDITPESLPLPCVLKTNNGCGSNFIYTAESPERSEDQWREIKRRFALSLGEPYSRAAVEWSYFYIKPRLFCEEYLPSARIGEDLIDYKVFVYNGVACLVQVDLDRYQGHKRVLMDKQWRALLVKYEYPLPDKIPGRPGNLAKLLEAAENIAGTLKFCRVDFYLVGEEVYFGEVAFYPEGGYGEFEPDDFNRGLFEGLKNGGIFDSSYYANTGEDGD